MAIDQPETIDAAGTDRETGEIILTIVDAWNWTNEQSHLSALQAKLNAYFGFIESGQMFRQTGTDSV